MIVCFLYVCSVPLKRRQLNWFLRNKGSFLCTSTSNVSDRRFLPAALLFFFSSWTLGVVFSSRKQRKEINLALREAMPLTRDMSFFQFLFLSLCLPSSISNIDDTFHHFSEVSVNCEFSQLFHSIRRASGRGEKGKNSRSSAIEQRLSTVNRKYHDEFQ